MGATKGNGIATKTGIPQTSLNKYVTVLEELDIIVREKPLGEKKKSLYRLKDSFFWFYYHFVRRYLVQIESGNGDRIWQKLKTTFPKWLGFQFERLSKEWCLKQNFSEELPIDLIAVNEENEALFVECKYRTNVNVARVEKALIRKSSLFPQHPRKEYLIFIKETSKEVPSQAKVVTLKKMIDENNGV